MFRMAILLLLTMAITNPCLAGEETVIAGVVHIQNGATPAEGLVTLTATEQWRAGGEDDDIFFGSVGQVLTDDDGHIYLMDSQLCEVLVYSADGEYLRTLSREGEGPGEVRTPNDMFLHPDGSIGLVQMFPGKIVKVNLDGTPAGNLSFGTGDVSQGQFSVLLQGLSRAGTFVLSGIKMSFSQDGSNKQTYFLSRCDDEAKEQVCYFSKENSINYGDFVLTESGLDFVWGRCALGPEGRLYVVPERNEYEIHIYTADGSLERVIEREYESLVRNDEQTERARQVLEGVGRNYPAPPRSIETEKTEIDITAIRVASDGEIWVRTSRGDNNAPSGMMTVFDVFDSEGHFVKQAALECPGDSQEDALFFLSKDRFIQVTRALDAFLSRQGISTEEAEEEEEEVPMEVIYFSIEG